MSTSTSHTQKLSTGATLNCPALVILYKKNNHSAEETSGAVSDMEASVEGPHFVVQQHNQVVSVLLKRRTGNLEPGGGCQQRAWSSTVHGHVCSLNDAR